jgi:hypothetical protein
MALPRPVRSVNDGTPGSPVSSPPPHPRLLAQPEPPPYLAFPFSEGVWGKVAPDLPQVEFHPRKGHRTRHDAPLEARDGTAAESANEPIQVLPVVPAAGLPGGAQAHDLVHHEEGALHPRLPRLHTGLAHLAEELPPQGTQGLECRHRIPLGSLGGSTGGFTGGALGDPTVFRQGRGKKRARQRADRLHPVRVHVPGNGLHRRAEFRLHPRAEGHLAPGHDMNRGQSPVRARLHPKPGPGNAGLEGLGFCAEHLQPSQFQGRVQKSLEFGRRRRRLARRAPGQGQVVGGFPGFQRPRAARRRLQPSLPPT